ncbi:MAG: LacI family DNA-binding transcriptional regulator [Lachnospiraceae bacterium]|nr:LacI family DNA-binding transcriptional regulator [Lachnospiraceae bacterium]
MAATIKDIAKKVGVSPSTVSRVINGTASISEETKRKIHQAMKELDYHPNSFARSLVNGNTFIIGLVIDAGNSDSFSNAFFVRSVSAIETVAQTKGYNVLITNDSSSENNNAVKNLVLERKVDGIILPVQCMTQELVELMLNHQIPFVVMGEPEQHNQKIFWIDMDNAEGARLAVEHLLSQNYKCPILLAESQETIFEKKRSAGYIEVCRRHQIAHPMVFACDSDEKVRVLTEQIASGAVQADSVICANNIIAFKVLRALKNKGINVPESIGIIAFDNYPLAEYLEPALSVVDIDTYKLGEQAANILFGQIRDKQVTPSSALIPTQIIARESTGK